MNVTQGSFVPLWCLIHPHITYLLGWGLAASLLTNGLCLLIHLPLWSQGEAHLPGSYSLVVSYPRKVIVDGTPGSLEDSGITADTALFLEPRTA